MFICKNINKLLESLNILKHTMSERKSVITGKGIADPKFGYIINEIRFCDGTILINISMLERAIKENDTVKPFDNANFIVCQGKIYSEDEWQELRSDK